jgi:flagellar basal-body rod protein FlgB
MSDTHLTIGAVSLALDMAQRRAEIASHNVANADMPNGTVQRADFSNALGLLQRVADGGQMDASRLASVHLDQVSTQQVDALDGGVSLDHEVTELALASAHYQALSEAVNRQFGLMSLALSGDQS